MKKKDKIENLLEEAKEEIRKIEIELSEKRDNEIINCSFKRKDLDYMLNGIYKYLNYNRINITETDIEKRVTTYIDDLLNNT